MQIDKVSPLLYNERHSRSEFSKAFNLFRCNLYLQSCTAKDLEGKSRFLKPFAYLPEMPADYIDGFLNTLFYFCSDFIGDFLAIFERFATAEYRKEKR